jgi:DNA-binding beta-propeller fold protein YncE
MNTCRTLVGLLLAWPAWVWPQSIITTLSVGNGPSAVAINHATQTIYIADIRAGTVTIVDGTTDSTTTVQVGNGPIALAVNETTNKIYVANWGNFPAGTKGSISVIDGVTNSVTQVTLSVPQGPASVAVNSSTNKIYVANNALGNVTVVDGATNSTTTVTDPNASGLEAIAVAVNPVTNKIYVANSDLQCHTFGSVTVIDGTTNLTTTVTDPNAVSPIDIAVDPVTDKIYVANMGGCPNGGPNKGNVTVIDGATNAVTTITDPNALNPGGISGAGFAVAVDSTHNKIYVINEGSKNVTVIDGATNSTTTVTYPNAAAPLAVAVNDSTNTVFVANAGCFFGSGCSNLGSNPGSITVIDGDNNSTETIIDPKANGPDALAIDPKTNRIYVANAGSGNLTIVDAGRTATTHTLAVLLPGSGSGTVTSSPLGINCGTSCAASFPSGTAVSLGALAALGSDFSGWSGPCTGTSSCDLTLSADGFVTATFSSVPIAVPNVVGLTQAAATTAITGAGLVVGTSTQQSSSTVALGDVISESPAAGTNVASGAEVNLVVSSGCSSCGGGGGGGAFAGLELCGMLLIWLWRAFVGRHLEFRSDLYPQPYP